MQRLVFMALIGLLISASGVAFAKSQLILLAINKPNCGPCQAWEAEVGSLYDSTQESKAAILARISLSGLAAMPLKLRQPVLYTPTFILVACTTEVGRVTGYSNDAAFWTLLQEALENADAQIAKLPMQDKRCLK